MLQNIHTIFPRNTNLVHRICAQYKHVLTKCTKRKYCSRATPAPTTPTPAPPQLQMSGAARVLEAKHHDVLLYAAGREHAKWFHTMNAAALSQLGCWLMVGCAFLDMKPVEIPKEVLEDDSVSWWRKRNFAKYKEVMAAGCFILAAGVVALSVWHTCRNVQHVVLRKGGHLLTFGMRVPMYGDVRYVTVPVQEVSSVVARVPGPTARVQLKSKRWRYLIDCEGTFHRPGLYDQVVGVKRF